VLQDGEVIFSFYKAENLRIVILFKDFLRRRKKEKNESDCGSYFIIVPYLCRLMIRVGKIVATHGLTGSLIMTHVLDSSKWLKKGQTLLLEMQKGSFIPYFVSQCKENNTKEYIINLEDIDKVEAAKRLVTKHVYVDEAILSAFAKQSPLLWINFKVVDAEHGELGTISDATNTGYQWIGNVTYKNKEVLIPLTDQVITDVNIKTKTVSVTLPDGLLDIYLG
jgi:16S rRNA processing protein RimM